MSEGLFSKFTTDNLDEQAEDRLGGGFQTIDSDIYVGNIKMAYWLKSKEGANAIFLQFDYDEGKSYTETVYFTNKQGENFYLTDNKKKAPLAGFIVVNDICVVATEKELSEQTHEMKVVNVYDYDAKKELPKEVPVLVDLIGKSVALGIMKVKENKGKKDSDGKFQLTSEVREKNAIDKVFHPEHKVTIPEVREAVKKNEAPVAKFWEAWLAKNKGQIKDKREIKDGQGAPPKSGGAPTAGGAPRASIFGKKS